MLTCWNYLLGRLCHDWMIDDPDTCCMERGIEQSQTKLIAEMHEGLTEVQLYRLQ